MRVSDKTLEFIRDLVTGGSALTPYKTGPQLVTFFKNYGFEGEYGPGFPSRGNYAYERLNHLNGSATLDTLLTALLSPINFVNTEFNQVEAISRLNEFLEFDGYQIVPAGKKCKVQSLIGDQVISEWKGHLDVDFIREQFEKCESKIADSDYDGAITNARSLLEGVIADIYERIRGAPMPRSGDLKADYKTIKDTLNLSDDKYSDESVKQILRGLVTIVDGIDRISNQMGDRHRRKVKPRRHHAKLVVNATKTLVDFLYDSFEYQHPSKSKDV